MQRIGLDCRLAGEQHAGIGRYTQNLVQRLVTNQQYYWVLFFFSKKQANEILGDQKNLPTNVEIIITPVRHYSLKEQLVLPIIFNQARLDLLHIPHFNIPIFYSGKIVVTIHDLLWHEQRGSHVTTLPSWQYWLKYGAYQFTVKQAVNRAKKIFVPSETVAKIVKKYYPNIKTKLVTTYEGIADSFLSTKIEKKPTKNQLVYTGSLYPHKNIEVVFRALKKLPEFNLKLVGSRSVFQQETMKLAKKYQVENQVEFLGRLSDQQLIELYQESYALVFPSLSEGFGLPGLEAMAVGLPVIASDIPIFQEIYQDSAAYFDPNSAEELVEKIRILGPSRAILAKTGKKLITKYSWSTMADTTLAIYQACL